MDETSVGLAPCVLSMEISKVPSPPIPIQTSSWAFLLQTMKPHRRRLGLLFLTLLISITVSVLTPFVTSKFIDGVIGTASAQHLITLAIITILLAFVAQCVAVAETWSAESLSWDTTNAVRLDLIRHVLSLDTPFHTSHTVGELIDRVDGDVSQLTRFLSRFVVMVVGNSLLILAVLAMLFTLDVRIAATLGFVVLIAFLTLTSIRKRATPLWRKERDASAHWYGELSEHLEGLEDIQAACAAPWVLGKNTLATRAWYTATMRAQMMGYAMVSSTVALFGVGTAAVLGLAVIQAQNGMMTIGSVYLVFQYTLMLRTPVEQIRNELQDFQQADASVRRVIQLLNQQPTLLNAGTSALRTGQHSIVLENVTFSWKPGQTVLNNVNLTFPPGSITGIVGRTGSGKTTLTRLVCRMIDPDMGSVRFDGVNLRDVPLEQIRAKIGVMSQDVRVIHATLRENLTWFDGSINDHTLIAALNEVGLGEWFQELSDGLDTWLGIGGVSLSAGESQLIACTRILLRNPEIVILDEASSRLDPATERKLHVAFTKVLRNRTALIIAHRLETVSFADDILVMENGKVVEHGQRLALIANPQSRFSQMIAQTETEIHQ